MRAANSSVASPRIGMASGCEPLRCDRARRHLARHGAPRRAHERSVAGLLAFVLAGLLVAGAAISGLAMVSTWPPTAAGVSTIRGDHETRSFGIWDDLPCCHETQ